jgi:hypothetical protein
MTPGFLRSFGMAIPESKEDRMDTTERPPPRRRRGALAIAATALVVAVALPASGALAGDGGASGDRSASEASSGAAGSVQIQQQRPDDRQAPDRDCPEKDRGGQTTPNSGSQEL